MQRGTKEAVEAGAVVVALLFLAFYAFRSKPQVIVASSDQSTPQPNTPIDHAGASGEDYYNYNYPAVQGLSVATGENNSASTGCKAPTCGCTESQLLGDNAEFQRYLQQRLSGFIDIYEKNVLSFLPSWFTQYLYNTGPGLSHLAPIKTASQGWAPENPLLPRPF